jgi:zinc/manganese transport system ATP-binding protein
MRSIARCRAAPVNAIELQDVTLSLGGRDVLSRATFGIATGELIGVLGPNGAGKTTLIRAILGLTEARGGSVRVFGRAAVRGNPAVGYMPQTRSGGSPLRLSGREFVASVVNGHRLGLPLFGRRVRAEVDRVLDLVNAAELGRRLVAELSGGERQRLLLAQALIGKPRLLLLDEPLASLDPHYQVEAVAMTKRLQEELQITILVSAHEVNALLGAIDRVLYLGGGHAALGDVDDVITGPVLSRLYGAPIDVIRAQGRIFVMSGARNVENDPLTHANDAASPARQLLGVS